RARGDPRAGPRQQRRASRPAAVGGHEPRGSPPADGPGHHRLGRLAPRACDPRRGRVPLRSAVHPGERHGGRILVAHEGVSQRRLQVALLRPVPESLRDLVHHGHLRQPHEVARLPCPTARGEPRHLNGRSHAAYPFGSMAEQKATQPPDDLNLINAGYVADLYELYRADPSSVDPEWRARFDAGFAGLEPVMAAAPSGNGEGPTAAPGASAP